MVMPVGLAAVPTSMDWSNVPFWACMDCTTKLPSASMDHLPLAEAMAPTFRMLWLFISKSPWAIVSWPFCAVSVGRSMPRKTSAEPIDTVLVEVFTVVAEPASGTSVTSFVVQVVVVPEVAVYVEVLSMLAPPHSAALEVEVEVVHTEPLATFWVETSIVPSEREYEPS